MPAPSSRAPGGEEPCAAEDCFIGLSRRLSAAPQEGLRAESLSRQTGHRSYTNGTFAADERARTSGMAARRVRLAGQQVEANQASCWPAPGDHRRRHTSRRKRAVRGGRQPRELGPTGEDSCDRLLSDARAGSGQQTELSRRLADDGSPKNRYLLNLAARPGTTRLALGGLILAALAAAIAQNDCLVINLRLSGNSSTAAAGHALSRRAAAAAAGSDEPPRSGRPPELEALAYLQRYGYMNGTSGNANLISEDSFNEAVMSFQRFAGIPETGSVDALTVRYMQMPRCGNKDRSSRGEQGKRKRRRRRRKRYALQGSKWRRQELTYRISQYPTRFQHKREQVDAQIEKAFRIWSQVAPIEFVAKKEGRVHIDIRFASGEHGDGDPFDGPGNTLAHAYFPQYGGDAHFDDQEYWTVDSYAGTNIFQVAAHELGHSLGLGHSSVREALMAPFYQKYKPNFKLHADDILGIQALYGDRTGASDSDADSASESAAVTPSPAPPTSRSSSSSSTTTTTSGPDEQPTPRRAGGADRADASKPDLCRDTSFDAITRTEDGRTYAFKGQHYWLLLEEGVAPGYPARISRDWDGLPGNLDAALTWSDGKTFFFKGDKYWRYLNKRREPGYPKLISAGFAGIPNNVDAAFVWSGNGKTYFFKRDKYWRFDSRQEPPVSSQYPKSIRNWSGLPATGVDAAFKWENGATYFFKHDLYYRFDDRQFEVDSASRPGYPRPIADWWLGCPTSNLAQRRRQPDERPDELREAASSQSLLQFHRRASSLRDQEPLPAASGSLSSSLFASLSSLFPFADEAPGSADALESCSPGAGAADWTFHGAEEARQLRPKPAAVGSRWSFPPAGSREQSSSELRMEPERADQRASARVQR